MGTTYENYKNNTPLNSTNTPGVIQLIGELSFTDILNQKMNLSMRGGEGGQHGGQTHKEGFRHLKCTAR